MNGIVYIAFGDKYLNEAVLSLSSLKQHSPNLSTCLISDRSVKGFDIWLEFEPLKDKPALLNKPYALSSSDIPFDNFIFLDTDTYILGDITPLFNLLDYCDVAATSCRDRMPNIMPGLPYYNTGVILGRRDISFWGEWHKIYNPEIHLHNDQASFYDTVLQSSHKVITLASEFNLRLNSKTIVRDKVYILHGRDKRLITAIETINRVTVPRLWNETIVQILYVPGL